MIVGVDCKGMNVGRLSISRFDPGFPLRSDPA
jgi:hypothetical protein